MQDMKTKFGAEVERFRYAFVLPLHMPGWDQPMAAAPVPEAAAPAVVAEGASAPRRRATDKRPTFIEVKPRGN